MSCRTYGWVGGRRKSLSYIGMGGWVGGWVVGYLPRRATRWSTSSGLRSRILLTRLRLKRRTWIRRVAPPPRSSAPPTNRMYSSLMTCRGRVGG